jgi:hypothetical protein
VSADPTARRRVLALLVGSAGAAFARAEEPAAPLEPSPLDALMALLAQRRHGVAAFRQQQFLSVLKHPLDSSGLLLYEAPDHLEQRTEKPHPQSVVVDHGLVRLQLGARERTLRLADYPQLVPLIESIRATLAGDRPALEREFQLEFNGELAHWELLLVPRDPALAAQLQRIRLSGEGAAISEVEVLQTGGDRSLMRITERE